MFGVSISDHQSEASDDRFPVDTWDVWERRDGVVPRGNATDFWNRWEEDVLNAHRLGCRAFRFSIAWARVEPRPGEFDPVALDHYRTIVVRLRELGMEPIVTLCHFVWPQHVEERGGLRSEQFATWFAAYAARVRAALEPHVRYWLTFNEPNILLQGFYKLWFQSDFAFPPGHRLGAPVNDQIDATITTIRHLFVAHTAARRMLQSGDDGRGNLVSANVFQLGLPPILQRAIDRNVLRLKAAEDWRAHFWRMAERPKLLESRVDVLIAPASRIQPHGFDISHVVSGPGALVRSESPVHTLAGLNGQTIAFVRSRRWEQAAALQALLDRSRIAYFDGHDDALGALDSGAASAFVADDTILRALARTRPEYRIIDERFTHHVYAIAIEAGHPALVDAVQQAIRALQLDAGCAELRRRYFPATPDDDRAPSFQPLPPAPHVSGLGHVQKRGRVIVGVARDDMPRIELTHSDVFRTGFEFDLGRMLAGAIFGDPSRVEFRRAEPPRPASLRARLRERVDDWLRAYTIFSTFVSSSWWYLGMRGQLPDYLCPRACVGQLDFVAFDYYFGVSAPTPAQLRRLARSAQRQFNVSALWAGGLHQALRYYHAMFPDLPILIAENGFADDPRSARRGRHIADHLRAVQRAVAEGIDVRAYCVWSITSNREWGLPQEAASDFGLYYVDMDGDTGLERRETPSAEIYRKLIQQRGASA